MTASPTTSTVATAPIGYFRKYLMPCALALSLVLHIGAALIIIIAGGFGTDRKSSTNFVIQDISLTPSISAPVKTVTAPPDPHPAMTSPTPTPNRETEITAQEPTPERPSNPSSGSPGNVGGLMSTPLGLGMTYGYFSTLADGRSLRDEIRSYYFDMVEKINREWWDKAKLLKEPLRQDGIFELLVQRDGTIVSIQMQQGTGSREADQLLTEIIRNASPLSPLPATYDPGLFRAPLRIKAPSFLFRVSN